MRQKPHLQGLGFVIVWIVVFFCIIPQYGDQKPVSSGERYTVLNFGESPWDKEEKLTEFHRRFLAYLSEEIGIKIILNISPDYGTLQKDLEANNIQIASFTPGAYADALNAIPQKMKYLATIKWHDDYYYEGYIFTRKNSKIKTIGDMKGKTIAFTDYGSSSGYKYPVSIFLNRGIHPDSYFSRIFFMGSHQSVLQAVMDGNVDIGATYDRAYSDFQNSNKDPFKIILKTPKIPFGAYAVSTKVPNELFQKLRRALMGLNRKTRLKDGTPVLESDYYLSGFVVKDESLYAPIRETALLISKYELEKEKTKK